MSDKKQKIDNNKLDRIVAEANRNRQQRESSYRERALKMFPWICGKCQREFNRSNVSELTVHHRDHDHDNNPEDGSNWELLCIYCHDNEHARLHDLAGTKSINDSDSQIDQVKYSPFAGLKDMLDKK